MSGVSLPLIFAVKVLPLTSKPRLSISMLRMPGFVMVDNPFVPPSLTPNPPPKLRPISTSTGASKNGRVICPVIAVAESAFCTNATSAWQRAKDMPKNWADNAGVQVSVTVPEKPPLPI